VFYLKHETRNSKHKLRRNVTSAYQKDWIVSKAEKTRIASQERVYQTFLNLFDNILKKKFKGKILDLGCGDGALVQLLNTKKDIIAEGIDIGHGINFETDRLPYKNNSFDIAIMYSVIEHIHNPGNILTEVKRILKPGGAIIIITANFDLTSPLTYDTSFYNDPTHIHPYNYISIEHLMRLYGFKKDFIGLWTVKKSASIWKMSPKLQFTLGALLPFSGATKYAPSFLKGKSKSMICVFNNDKRDRHRK